MPRDRAEVILELSTLAICVPAAPMVMVGVAGHHLPTWCLIVAGMGAGWASDAIAVLFGHYMGLYRTRRAAAWTPPDFHSTTDRDPTGQPRADLRHGDHGPPHRRNWQ